MRLITQIGTIMLFAACSATPLPADDTDLSTDEQKTLYALGMVISRNLAAFSFDEKQIAAVQAGLQDGALGREARVSLETYTAQIDALLKGRMETVLAEEKKKGAAFRDGLAAEPGASTMDSGLIYSEIEAGSGAAPESADTVKIHYTGTLRDGSVFDSSREGPNAGPAQFALNGVIPCFAEGVGKMKVGGKSRIVCPPDIAYGDRGSPPSVPPGATLVFEVELLEIVSGDAGTP